MAASRPTFHNYNITERKVCSRIVIEQILKLINLNVFATCAIHRWATWVSNPWSPVAHFQPSSRFYFPFVILPIHWEMQDSNLQAGIVLRPLKPVSYRYLTSPDSSPGTLCKCIAFTLVRLPTRQSPFNSTKRWIRTRQAATISFTAPQLIEACLPFHHSRINGEYWYSIPAFK